MPDESGDYKQYLACSLKGHVSKNPVTTARLDASAIKEYNQPWISGLSAAAKSVQVFFACSKRITEFSAYMISIKEINNEP
jgi:hypothetical protein